MTTPPPWTDKTLHMHSVVRVLASFLCWPSNKSHRSITPLWKTDHVVFPALLWQGLGLLTLLDEQCRLGNSASDEQFLRSAAQQHKHHSRFSLPRMAVGEFEVQHTAGGVRYKAQGLVAKNRDLLSPGEWTCLQMQGLLRPRGLQLLFRHQV